LEELDKTEKTFIGTRMEIILRTFLDLRRGRLDLRIGDHDVDVKFTTGNNWMIPREAVDHVCVLIGADERNGVCFAGLLLARQEYLSGSINQDKKRTLSAQGFANIYWLLRGVPYPPSFWRSIPVEVLDEIFSGASGNERVTSLFRQVQDRPIGREIIDAVAREKDFTRRVRADRGSHSGTRDTLANEGILLLSGNFGRALVEALGLPPLPSGSYMSHRVANQHEAQIATDCGYFVRWPTS
jgi:hypothetical protein